MIGDFCRLLVIFANRLNPDQDRQNVGPDLDSNRFKNYMAFKGFNNHTFRRLNNKGAEQTRLNCMLIYAAQ